MKSVRLTLSHDAETIHPMHRFVADHDAFDRYRLVHWKFAGEGPNVLVFHVVGEIAVYREALAELDDPPSFDLAPAGDRSFYVYVQDRPNETATALVEAFSRGSLVPVTPVEYRDDWTIRFTLVGESADLTAALEALPDGIEPTVEHVGEYRGADAAAAALTGRQREAVRTARELGYFAVPREATVEDVAAELDCAPGTAAEHLRKAQSRVMAGLEL